MARKPEGTKRNGGKTEWRENVMAHGGKWIRRKMGGQGNGLDERNRSHFNYYLLCCLLRADKYIDDLTNTYSMKRNGKQ
jgi:hypothetical protein